MGDILHIDINNVELYIDRFMEGETSNTEEKELYRFFATEKDLPQHIAKYREMFAYFESGLDESLSAQALTEAEHSTAKVVQLKPVDTKKPKKRIFMFAASIAASIVLIFTLVESFACLSLLTLCHFILTFAFALFVSECKGSAFCYHKQEFAYN